MQAVFTSAFERPGGLKLARHLFKVVGKAFAPRPIAFGSDAVPAAIPVRQFSQFVGLFQGMRSKLTRTP